LGQSHSFGLFVVQIMDGLCQLSEITKPDGIFAILETSDGALGNSRTAREKLGGFFQGAL
jgi:hypothetical protein